MVQARFDFLNKGYYQPIAQAINDYLQDLVTYNLVSLLTVVDSGCEVGYYLNFIRQNYSQPINLYGIDISKEAIKKAASAYSNSINWFVSSSKVLPFLDESVGCILSVFAPLQVTEMNRILKKNGYLLAVTPAADHLIEYRKILFDHVSEIDNSKVKDKLSEYFILLKFIPIHYKVLLKQCDINNLLQMTPYYWKSSLQKQIIFQGLQEMTVTISMTLNLFQKRTLSY
jgi:23S rRNA (guanine745-N1)-methyltransferase